MSDSSILSQGQVDFDSTWNFEFLINKAKHFRLFAFSEGLMLYCQIDVAEMSPGNLRLPNIQAFVPI